MSALGDSAVLGIVLISCLTGLGIVITISIACYTYYSNLKVNRATAKMQAKLQATENAYESLKRDFNRYKETK